MKISLLLTSLLISISLGCSRIPSRVSLPVPHIAQKAYLCVPASASMVLEYYGEGISQDSLKELAGHRKDFAGTYYSDMITGLEKIGHHWKAMGFELDSVGFELGLKEIKRNLSAGRPVLISTSKPPGGHTMVVIGYDDRQQVVELMDPASTGSRSMSYKKLENIWHDDFQYNDRWILVTSPRNSR